MKELFYFLSPIIEEQCERYGFTQSSLSGDVGMKKDAWYQLKKGRVSAWAR